MLQEVAEVRSTVVGAATGQISDLPVLSAAELCALNAVSHPVLDTATLAWWNAQEDQQNLAQMAFSELARRQLFDPATRLAAQPLDLVLAARTSPAFILVTRERPDAEPRPGRLYGASNDLGKRAVLLEHTRPNPASWSGLAYSYQLVRIQAQADAITEWIVARKGRTVEVYLPGTGIVNRPVERFVITSPARKGMVGFHRDAFNWTSEFHVYDLKSLIVGMMAGIPYFPNRLPIRY